MEKYYPTEEEKLDAMRQLNQAWHETASMKPGPDREKRLAAIHRVSAKVAESYDMPMNGEGPIDTGLKYGLKAINYGAGLMQAPILAGAEAIAGPHGKAKEVLMSAIDPRKPNITTGEVAKDIGIPEGPSFSDIIPGYAPSGTPGLWPPNKRGPLDPTMRGTVSTALDFLLSPAGIKGLLGNSESKLAGLTAADIQNIKNAAREAAISKPSVASKAVNTGKFALDPLGEGVSRVGKKIYNSPFKAADIALADSSAPPLSDVLNRHGVWGSPSTIAEKGRELTTRLGEGVDNDIVKAYGINMFDTVPRDEIINKAKLNLKKSTEIGGQTSGAKEAAKRLEQEFTDAYGVSDLPNSTNEFGINELQDLKRSMQAKAARQRAYVNSPPNASLSPNAGDSMVEAQQLGNAYKSVANKARRGVENLADEAEPGLGGEIYKKNADLSSLAEGQDYLDKMASQSLGSNAYRNWPSAMATGLMGGSAAYGMGYHNPYELAAAAALGAAASSTAARTGLGLGMMRSAPWGTNAIRTYLNQKYSPWFKEHEPFSNLDKGEKHE